MDPSKKKKIEKEIWTLQPCEMDPEMENRMRTTGLRRFKREKELTRRALRRMLYFTDSHVSAMKSRKRSQKHSLSKPGLLIETLSDFERRKALETGQPDFMKQFVGLNDIPPIQPIQTKPEIEFPPEDFTLTKRSQKNYQKYIHAEKHTKKNDIIESTKKKMEELKKLKEIMDAAKNKFTCHKHEREQDRIIKKKKFIEDLALQLGCRPEDLKHKEDELYHKHEQQELEKRKLKRTQVDKDLEWMERFLAEFPAEQEKPKKPKKIKKPEIKEIVIEPPIEIFEEEASIIEIQPEEIEEVIEKKPSKGTIDPDRILSDIDLKKGRRKSRKKSMRRKSTKRKSTSGRRKSRKSIKRRQSSMHAKAKRKGDKRKGSIASAASGISIASHHYIEPEPVSVLDPDLLECFKAFSELQKEKRLLRKKEKQRMQIPKDVYFITIPSTVYFHDFVPGKKYHKKIKILNRGGHKIYFKPDSVQFKTEINDKMLIELDPWMAFYAQPTEPITYKVIFNPVQTTRHLECDIIFSTRYGEKKWKQFSVHVSCSPIEPIISLNTNLISFKGNKIWNNEIPVKNLIIKNKGLVPCRMTITSSLTPMPTIPDHEEHVEEEEDFKYPFIIAHKIIKKNLKNNEIIYDEVEKENEETHQKMQETIKLHPQSKSYIPIGFIKTEGYGILKDEWLLNFTSENFKKEEKLQIEAFIEYTPLLIDPHVLDFQVVLINDGVQQNSFMVTNIGKKAIKLNIKIPKELSNHVQIPHRSPVVAKGKTISVLVRLAIKSSFCIEASKYIDSSTNVLDFPVFLSTTEPDISGPPIEVHVMAIITRSMGISINPAVLSLGKVYTHETIVASFYLSNHTLATHYYGFLNLPKWVMIQPNYGFGVIAPGEILDLELLFSPGVEQMDEPGNTVFRSFILKCTTAERFANLNNIDAYKVNDSYNPRFKVYWIKPEDLLFPDVISTYSLEYLGESESEEIAISEALLRPADISDIQELNKPSQITRTASECKEEPYKPENYEIADEIAEIPSLCTSTDRLFAILGVKAIVCDPRCELSAQIVVLKPTSYNSFSIAKLHLRCPNRASGAHCYCGRVKGTKHSDWSCTVSRFEFFSNDPFLSVEPCKGEISMNQDIKISLIMRPEPPFHQIEDLARTTKARAEEIRLLNEWFENKKKNKKKSSQKAGKRKSARRKSGRRKSSRRKSSRKSVKRASVKRASMSRKKSSTGRRKSKRKSLSRGKKEKKEKKEKPEKQDIIPTFSIDPASVTLTSSDMTEALIEILKIQEPKDFRCKVKCLIETKMPSNIPIQYEELDLHIYGTITTPDFVLFYEMVPPQNFEFPITAIGSKSYLGIQICNTSGQDILLEYSPFQTTDVFWCPSPQPLYQVRKSKRKKVRKGIFMEPGQVIKFPIVFQPEEEGEVIQYIDFYTKNTYVPTRIQGTGVVPLYSITPEFTFAKMKPTSYAGVAKCGLIIRNLCQAELHFNLKPLSIKEGPPFEIRKSVALPPTLMTRINQGKTPVKKEEPFKPSSAQVNPVDELFALFEETDDEAKKHTMSKVVPKSAPVETKKKTKKEHKTSETTKKYKNTTFSNLVPPQVKKALVTSENIQDKHVHYFRFTESVVIPPMEVGYIDIDFRACPLYMYRAASKTSTASWKSLKRDKKSLRRQSSRKSLSRKSVSRKSVSRKSVSRKSMKGPKRKSIRKSIRRHSVMSMSRKPRLSRLSKYGESVMPEEEEDPNYYTAHTRLYYAKHNVVQDYYFLGIPGETTRQKASKKNKFSVKRMSRRSSRRMSRRASRRKSSKKIKK